MGSGVQASRIVGDRDTVRHLCPFPPVELEEVDAGGPSQETTDNVQAGALSCLS